MTAREGRKLVRAADVLTVGDATCVRKPVQQVLSGCGWTVRHASRAEPAFRWLRHNRAAVVVMQVAGTSTDVLSGLRVAAHPPEIVVVAHGSVPEEEILRRGVHDVVRVPVDSYDLLWSIVSAWHAWQKQSEERRWSSRNVPVF